MGTSEPLFRRISGLFPKEIASGISDLLPKEISSRKVEMNKNIKDVELNNLGFVRTIAINVILFVSSLYEFVKQNFGPLMSVLGTIEKVAVNVFGPLSDVEAVAAHLLLYLDNKVEEIINKYGYLILWPNRILSLFQSIVKKLWELAVNFILGALRLVIYYYITAPWYFLLRLLAVVRGNELLYELERNALLFAVRLSRAVWEVVRKQPFFYALAQRFISVGAHFTVRYNKLITELTAKGTPIFRHFPLVPLAIEGLAETYIMQIQLQEKTIVKLKEKMEDIGAI